MSKSLSTLLALAEAAARLAGDALRGRGEEYQGIAAEDGRDIKLLADRAAEKLIINHLRSGTDYNVLSEESGWADQVQNRPDEPFWVVDPLDGSANYNRHIPLCCVSIALITSGQPVLGVCYDFNMDRLFSGGQGIGAKANGVPVTVSDVTSKDKAILMTGLPVWRDFSSEALSKFAAEFAHWKKVRMIGSAGLSTALVGIGSADRYQEDNIMFWDVAAGAAITLAAGGRVKMSDGPLDQPKTVMIDNNKLPF